MTVERNRSWAGSGGLGEGGIVAATDAEVRAVVEDARRAGGALPDIGLLGGDLCRTLGGRGEVDRLWSGSGIRGMVDTVRVHLDDGSVHWFVSHLVARRSWWRGPVSVVMNAEFIGGWDVAPRGHPGDGRVETLEGDPDLRTRWQIRSRLATGTHLPHPAITQGRVGQATLSFGRPLDVYLDGDRVGRTTELALLVEPDALRVVV